MVEMGMPTLIEAESLETCAALCRELGLQFIEVNMNLPQFQPDRLDAGYFNAIAEQYGIYYTIHLDENLDACDFNPYVAAAWRRTACETIEAAKKLQIPILNMHLSAGVYFTLPERKAYLYEENRTRYFDSILRFRDECTEAIGGAEMRICIENCSGYRPFQLEAIDLLLQSPCFGLTFDIGHNHGCGGVDERVILDRADHLHHMHVHDALGKKNHLALGTGEIDIRKYLNLAQKQHCRAVLENKTIAGLKQSVEWIRANGLR